MVVFFVESNENTYPKGRALVQIYRVVPITKRWNNDSEISLLSSATFGTSTPPHTHQTNIRTPILSFNVLHSYTLLYIYDMYQFQGCHYNVGEVSLQLKSFHCYIVLSNGVKLCICFVESLFECVHIIIQVSVLPNVARDEHENRRTAYLY